MTNKEMIQIGNRIKSLRKERNLSQEEVAKQLDISRQAEAKPVPTWEQLKADIKAEIKRCIWALWALLLTLLFFAICWFFDIHLGWDVYVWHYVDLYCYAWTACFLVFLGGILQKKRFVVSICTGCVLTVLCGQLIALYTRSHSPLKLNESWIAPIIFWNLALIVGLFLEYRAKKKPWKAGTKVWMSCVVLLFALVSFGGFKTNYTYNRGAEDGYRAGYEAGLQDAKTGEDTRAEQEEEDCLEYREKYKVGTRMWGMSGYKGFYMHWYSGYEAGYKEGMKN